MHTALQFPACSRLFCDASRANRRFFAVLPTVLPPVLSFSQLLGRTQLRRVLPPFRDPSARAGRIIPNSVRAIHTVSVGVPFAALIEVIAQRPFLSKSISVLINYQDRREEPLQTCCGWRSITPLATRIQEIHLSPCPQVLRRVELHAFARHRFPNMLLSPLCFHAR
jgi:hypothetical protein